MSLIRLHVRRNKLIILRHLSSQVFVFKGDRFTPYSPFSLPAVGYRPNHTAKDWSLLRLSVEVPYGLKTAVEACSSNCMKDPNKSYELKSSYGFSKIVGKLAVGFGKKRFEIVALTWPLSSGGIVNR